MPVTNFFWDGDNLLQEYDDAGATTAQYSTEPESFGNVSSQRRGGQSHYYHHDPLGSTTELTDASGNVTDTRRYKAFGETVEESGLTDFPFQFVGRQGYYLDEELGRYYVRRRDLLPLGGRWLSIDELLEELGVSSYAYVANSPVVLVDPSGRIIAPYLTPNTPEEEDYLKRLREYRRLLERYLERIFAWGHWSAFERALGRMECSRLGLNGSVVVLSDLVFVGDCPQAGQALYRNAIRRGLQGILDGVATFPTPCPGECVCNIESTIFSLPVFATLPYVDVFWYRIVVRPFPPHIEITRRYLSRPPCIALGWIAAIASLDYQIGKCKLGPMPVPPPVPQPPQVP
jgi:RHS repeat-associated protein